jgi:hypothetical protein
MEWKEIATIVGSGSLLTAGLTHLLTQWRERGKLKIKGTISALHVAIALENYAAECADVAGDNMSFRSSKGGFGVQHSNIPVAPIYPDGVDWEALGVDLTTEALDFRLRVGEARGSISFFAGFADEQGIDETTDAAIELGLQAHKLADAIRKKRGIKMRQHWREDHNTPKWLAEQWVAVQERREAFSARLRKGKSG